MVVTKQRQITVVVLNSCAAGKDTPNQNLAPELGRILHDTVLTIAHESGSQYISFLDSLDESRNPAEYFHARALQLGSPIQDISQVYVILTSSTNEISPLRPHHPTNPLVFHLTPSNALILHTTVHPQT